jgi:TRAP-type C4-dicarboxylate transport system substrate-binding protein
MSLLPLLRAGVLAVLAPLSALATAQTTSTPVTLKVHHFLPASSTTHAKLLVPWCAKLEAESAGRLKCQIYPAMQLGGTPAQLYDQARDGVADVVWTLPGYTAGRFPVMEVFELPFMVRDAESSSKAAWEFWSRSGQPDFKDVVPLAIHMHEPGQLHLRDKPVVQLADFKGLKLRAPSRQTNKLLARLGATPVAMPAPQLADALGKGVIDGAALPWEVVPSIRVHEVVKSHTETDPAQAGLYSAVFLMAMNRKTYDGLPPDLRVIVDRNSGLALSASAGRLWDEARGPSRQAALARGNQIVVLTPQQTSAWARAAQPVAEEWVAEMNKRGLDGAGLLTEARAALARNAAAASAPPAPPAAPARPAAPAKAGASAAATPPAAAQPAAKAK